MAVLAIGGALLPVATAEQPAASSAAAKTPPAATGLTEYILEPSDGVPDDRFGTAVAVSGTRVVVGAPQARLDLVETGGVYVFDLDPDAGTWSQTRLIPDKPVRKSEFGYSVAVDDDRVVVGAPGDRDVGIAYVFDLDPDTDSWRETTLVPPDDVDGRDFGYAVAVDGSNVVVGSPAPIGSTVHAYDIDRSGEVRRSAMVDNEGTLAHMGRDVGVSDGRVAVMTSSAWCCSDGLDTTGDITVYRFRGDELEFERGLGGYARSFDLVGDRLYNKSRGGLFVTDLTGVETELFPRLGAGSVSGSADRLAIGQWYALAPDGGTGAATVFIEDANSEALTWNEVILFPSDRDDDVIFGATVDVDATLVVVGAPSARGQGRVHVFEGELASTPRTSTWKETRIFDNSLATPLTFNESLLLVPDINPVFVEDGTERYRRNPDGSFTKLSGLGYEHNRPFSWDLDGDEIAVGVNDDPSWISVYTPGAAPDEVVEDRLTFEDPDSSFHWAVAIDDGVVVGVSPSRIVRVFERRGFGEWTRSDLTDDVFAGPRVFGTSVAMDTNRLVIGAGRELQRPTDTGAVVVMDRDGAAFTNARVLRASDGVVGDAVGDRVALEDDVIAVEAPGADDGDGAVYIFTWSPEQQRWTETKLPRQRHLCGVANGRVLVSGPTQSFERNDAGVWVGTPVSDISGPCAAHGDEMIVVASAVYLYTAPTREPVLRCNGVVATVTGAGEIIGTDGDDVLVGSPDDDVIDGRGGNDLICGRSGDDTLIGGPGADILIGGPGRDVADYSTAPGPVRLALNNRADDGTPGEADLIDISVEGVIGSPFNDLILGNSLDNHLDGGPGNDLIRGRAGNDTLTGGPGNDKLIGGPGNDTLAATTGTDYCRGSAGTDTYLNCETTLP